MWNIKSMILAGGLVGGMTNLAAAQIQDPEAAVMEATLLYVRKGLPAGNIAVSAPERLKTRLATAAPKVTGALVTRMEERDELMRCWAAVIPCQGSVSGIIDILEVLMVRDVAIVKAGITTGVRTTPSLPRAYYHQTRFVLENRDGTWVVVKSEIVARS